MILPPFIGLGAARRDNPNFVTAHRVRNEENATFHHADDVETLLTVVFAVVQTLDGKWIVEDSFRGLKAHAVRGEIRSGLGSIPFEIVVNHIRVTRSRCKGRSKALPRKDLRTADDSEPRSQRLNTSRNFCILRSCSHVVRFIAPLPRGTKKPDNSCAYDKARLRAFTRPKRPRYNFVMSPAIKQIIERAESWPEEDQEELAEIARQIEARRTGVYRATAEELRALDEADRSGIASEEEVEAAFRSFRRQ
jgi:hypothetical protein